jgi:hypothetical protein
MVVDMMGVGDDGVAAGHDAWQLARAVDECRSGHGRKTRVWSARSQLHQVASPGG